MIVTLPEAILSCDGCDSDGRRAMVLRHIVTLALPRAIRPAAGNNMLAEDAGDPAGTNRRARIGRSAESPRWPFRPAGDGAERRRLPRFRPRRGGCGAAQRRGRTGAARKGRRGRRRGPRRASAALRSRSRTSGRPAARRRRRRPPPRRAAPAPTRHRRATRRRCRRSSPAACPAASRRRGSSSSAFPVRRVSRSAPRLRGLSVDWRSGHRHVHAREREPGATNPRTSP